MNEYYPFLPKTTNPLSAGDFWSINLKEDKFACCIVVELLPVSNKPPSHKLYFLAGLLNWKSDQPPTKESISGATTLGQGLVNISIVGESDGILGHVDLAESNITPDYFVNRNTYSEKQSRLMCGLSDLRAATVDDYNKYQKIDQWTSDEILHIAKDIEQQV